RLAEFGAAQRDEVDRDQPALAAQAQLAQRLMRGFEIEIAGEDIWLGRATATARVDVNRGERGCPLDDQSSAALQSHACGERLIHRRIDAFAVLRRGCARDIDVLIALWA